MKQFRAKHNKTGQEVEFDGFVSLKQARFFNPYFVEWEEISTGSEDRSQSSGN